MISDQPRNHRASGPSAAPDGLLRTESGQEGAVRGVQGQTDTVPSGRVQAGRGGGCLDSVLPQVLISQCLPAYLHTVHIQYLFIYLFLYKLL